MRNISSFFFFNFILRLLLLLLFVYFGILKEVKSENIENFNC